MRRASRSRRCTGSTDVAVSAAVIASRKHGRSRKSRASTCVCLDMSGEPAGIRTQDTRIKSLSESRPRGHLVAVDVYGRSHIGASAPLRAADLYRRGCQRGCHADAYIALPLVEPSTFRLPRMQRRPPRPTLTAALTDVEPCRPVDPGRFYDSIHPAPLGRQE